MPASHNLVKKIHPVLEQVACDTGETTSFEVYTDGVVLILDEVNGKHLLTAAADIGTSWPVHATSTGKVFLAWDEHTSRSLKNPLQSFTRNTITSVEKLLQDSVAVRKQGYATTWCELEEEFAAVAAPIFTAAGELQGTLSIGGPASRLDRKRLQQLGLMLKEIAKRIH